MSTGKSKIITLQRHQRVGLAGRVLLSASVQSSRLLLGFGAPISPLVVRTYGRAVDERTRYERSDLKRLSDGGDSDGFRGAGQTPMAGERCYC